MKKLYFALTLFTITSTLMSGESNSLDPYGPHGCINPYELMEYSATLTRKQDMVRLSTQQQFLTNHNDWNKDWTCKYSDNLSPKENYTILRNQYAQHFKKIAEIDYDSITHLDGNVVDGLSGAKVKISLITKCQIALAFIHKRNIYKINDTDQTRYFQVVLPANDKGLATTHPDTPTLIATLRNAGIGAGECVIGVFDKKEKRAISFLLRQKIFKQASDQLIYARVDYFHQNGCALQKNNQHWECAKR